MEPHFDSESIEPPEREPEISFLLPKWDPVLSFSCAKDWAKDKPSFQCGCPNCLAKIGLTLCWHVEDFHNPGIDPAQRRFRIVSQRYARHAPELICPGYRSS